MTTMLKVDAVTRLFGGFKAVDGVSLQLKAGEILGIAGTNGAGKSTLFAAIAGQQPADAGQIEFDGQDITRIAHAEQLLGKREVRCLVIGEGRVECDLIDHRESRQGTLQILEEVVGLLRADGAHLLLHIRTELARQQEALHELADDVFGVRSAAAIAAGDELMAACIALADGLDRLDEVIAADGEDGVARDEVIDLRERRCFCHWVHFFLNMRYRPLGSASD